MIDNRISFSNHCAFCLRCVYSCQEKAISIKFFKKFFLLDEYHALKTSELPSSAPKFLTSKTRGFFIKIIK